MAHLNKVLLDSDNYIEDSKGIPFSELSNIIDQGHQLEKSIFFELLSTSYLESLNPVYKD